MTEVPKIVYDRLRAASRERTAPRQEALAGQEAFERAHPDADLLTGFAEQRVSATEREGLLNHLALCEGCREVIALALPAGEIPAGTNTVHATPVRVKAATGWLSALTMPGMRWAALAAAVAIVAAVLVLRPGTLNPTKLTSADPQGAKIASSVPAPRVESSPTNQSLMDKSAMNQSVAVLKNERALSLAEAHRTKKLNSGKDVTPMKQAESGMVLAENGTEPAQAGKLSDAPVNPGANERVEVAAASTAVQIEASSGQEAALMAQNDAQPVLKAKPPVETETSQLQGTLSTNNITQLPIQGRNVMSMAKAAAPTPQTTTKDVTINVTNGVTNNVTNNAANGVTNHVTWLITAGVLQRSLDGGHSWQDVMQNDHTLLCYATNEQEVWAGGRAGTLFHSVDSGLTWVQVQPSIKARTLGSDVNHIELQGRLEIVVSTVSDEIWISRDGGRSWENRMPPEHSR